MSRYVAIELKAGAFKPEHAGKMNAYLGAVERLMAVAHPPIGLILCKSKNKLVVEYALRDSRRPIGVATYRLTKVLPRELKPGLPTAAELEKRLGEGRP